MSDRPPESLPAPTAVSEGPALEAPQADAPAAQASSPESEWNEDLYQATCTVLVEPEPAISAWQGVGCLLVSVGLFFLSFLFSMDVRALAFLIPVMFLHETGHFLGMRAFGYRAVRMFFIPFFGAAVVGKKHAVPVWQQAVVLLLGPLPGIFLALALQLWLHPVGDTWPANLVLWLVFLNAFNLLPIVPLDGGRLFDVLLFSRRPALAVAFQFLAVLALFALTVLLREWVLGVLGVLLLLVTPARFRKARLQSTFRNNPLELPNRLEDLGDAQRRELFGWVERLNPLSRDPVGLAGHMRSLHESMVSRRPGMAVWLILLALYLGGIASSIAVVVIGIRHNSEHVERVRQMYVTELADSFFGTVREMNGLRARLHRLRDPKGRDQLEAKRLQGEEDRLWRELIAKWKEAPPGVRGDALRQVSRARIAQPTTPPAML